MRTVIAQLTVNMFFSLLVKFVSSFSFVPRAFIKNSIVILQKPAGNNSVLLELKAGWYIIHSTLTRHSTLCNNNVSSPGFRSFHKLYLMFYLVYALRAAHLHVIFLWCKQREYVETCDKTVIQVLLNPYLAPNVISFSHAQKFISKKIFQEKLNFSLNTIHISSNCINFNLLF